MPIPDCTGCGQQLRIHCPSATCGWWKCANKACNLDVFDPGRGVLLHNDGKVERLGLPS